MLTERVAGRHRGAAGSPEERAKASFALAASERPSAPLSRKFNFEFSPQLNENRCVWGGLQQAS